MTNFDFDGYLTMLPEGFVPVRGADASGHTLAVEWASTRDRSSWTRAIETVTTTPGVVNVFGGGNPRPRVLSGMATGGVDDVPEASVLFVDVDLAKPVEDGLPYLPDDATANRVMADIEAEMGLAQPFVNRTPGGQHRVYPLDHPVGREVIAGLASTLEAKLQERGFTMDLGTTQSITRMPRPAGTPHCKGGVVREVVNAVPVAQLTATTGLRYSPAPERAPVTSDDLAVRASALVGVQDVLAAAGLTHSGDSWGGDWTYDDGRTTTQARRASDCAEPGMVLLWGDSFSTAIGGRSGAPYSIVDWLASRGRTVGLTDKAAYAVACSIARAMVSQPWKFEGAEARATAARAFLNPTRAMLENTASQDPQRTTWPDEVRVTSAARDRLRYRGVNGAVALRRGYESHAYGDPVEKYPTETESAAQTRVRLHEDEAEETRGTLCGEGLEAAVEWLENSAIDLPRHALRIPYTLLADTRADANAHPVEGATWQVGPVGLGIYPVEHPVDGRAADAAELMNAAVPLVICSAGRDTAHSEDIYAEPKGKDPAPLPGDPQGLTPGLAQVVTDAIAAAARVEGIRLAPVGVESWASVMTRPGENGVRQPQMRGALTTLPLGGRTVYLVGREDWRHEPLVIDLADQLREYGATVRVIDTPEKGVTSRARAHIGGTYTLADVLQRGNDTLRDLMDSALEYEEAKRAATPRAAGDTGLVNILAAALKAKPLYAYDLDLKSWLRDTGELLEPCQPPHEWAAGILSRGAAISERLGWVVKPAAPKVREVANLLNALATRESVQANAESAVDSNPELAHLLYCRNGVVNLRTGELRPRQMGENNRRSTGWDYRPEAPHPQWDVFLRELLIGHEDLDATVDWLQAALANAVHGDVVEKLLILHGQGGDGKSVLENTLAHALGGYAIKEEAGIWTGEKGRFDSVRWVGARLLTSGEIGTTATLDSAVMKAVVTRGHQRAEVKGGRAFGFEATHFPLLTTNYLPRLMDTGDGVRRRVVIVPCLLHLPAEKRDLTLEPRLKAEAEGILAWLVEGAVRHYAALERDGRLLMETTLPATVKTATDEYVDSADLLSRFLDSMEGQPGWNQEQVRSSLVTERFGEWLRGENVRPWSGQAVRKAMTARGARVKTIKGVAYYDLTSMAIARPRETPVAITRGPEPAELRVLGSA